jgi:hypothetical protein
MVKINQPEAAEKYNIVNSPSLVYFRKKIPLLYDGKYLFVTKILFWLSTVNYRETCQIMKSIF